MGKSFEADQRDVENFLKTAGALGFYAKDGRLLYVVYTFYEPEYQKLLQDKAKEKLFYFYLDAEAEQLFGKSHFVFASNAHDPILGKRYIRVRIKHKRGAKEEVPATWDILKRTFNYGEMFYL